MPTADDTMNMDYRLDYSKWDKIVDSDESDSDEPIQPRVTRLDAPGSVTFGGVSDASVTLGGKETNASAAMQDKQSMNTRHVPVVTESSDKGLTVEPSVSATSHGVSSVPTSWTEKGATASIETKDVERVHYYWSQDRLCVHVRVPIAENTAAGEKPKYTVRVDGILPYSERNQAVVSPGQTQSLRIEQTFTQSDGEIVPNVVLQGELPHPVHLPEEDETVDWSVEQYQFDNATTPPLRYVLVSLFKATPVSGMTLWWKKVLRDEPTEIELTWVERNNAFQQAWDEAHEQFIETAKQGMPKYTL